MDEHEEEERRMFLLPIEISLPHSSAFALMDGQKMRRKEGIRAETVLMSTAATKAQQCLVVSPVPAHLPESHYPEPLTVGWEKRGRITMYS